MRSESIGEGSLSASSPIASHKHPGIVAIASHATSKLLGVDPRHDLSEISFSGMHSATLAGHLLGKTAISSSNRSHPVAFRFPMIQRTCVNSSSR